MRAKVGGVPFLLKSLYGVVKLQRQHARIGENLGNNTGISCSEPVLPFDPKSQQLGGGRVCMGRAPESQSPVVPD